MSYAQLQERGFEIIGGDSAETLAGTPYDDRLAGGKGDDVLAGGAGDDAYVFNPGDGYDAIMDTAGVNNIYLGAGFAPENLNITQGIGFDGQHYLDIDFSSGDRLSLQGSTFAHIDKVCFANGEVIPLFELMAQMPGMVLMGTEGDDTIQGLDGDDVLMGGAGNDAINGLSGNDALSGGGDLEKRTALRKNFLTYANDRLNCMA